MPERLRIIEVEPGDPQMVTFQGTDYPTAFPLATWLARFNGYEGELTDPDDLQLRYKVSLEPWRGRDPNETWLQVIIVPVSE